MGCISGSWWSFRGESSAIYEGYGDSFPGSCAAGLIEFSEEFSVNAITSRECCGTGFGRWLVSYQKMYPKIIGMRKKFPQYGWLAAAILFCKVYNKTWQLSLYMESDSVLIYHLSSKIKETCFNLQEILEEQDCEYLPSNVAIIDEDLENDLIVITPTSNGVENNEEFQLTDVAEGRVKVDTFRLLFSRTSPKDSKRSWKTKV